ncbi:MAG: hypothetical protein ACT4OD_04710 [Candidatus Nitrosotenuis sp.]
MQIIFLIILFIFANQTFSEEDRNAFESFTNLFFTIAGMAAVGTLVWGIYEYREARSDKRKETFIELAETFDSSKDMRFAKKILDTWAYSYSKDKRLYIDPKGIFSLRNIEWILSVGYSGRNDFEAENPDFLKSIEELGEEDLDFVWLTLRDSFDTLFFFFERLRYLQKSKRITQDELEYFRYFIDAAKAKSTIVEFLTVYKYRWHTELKLKEI